MGATPGMPTQSREHGTQEHRYNHSEGAAVRQVLVGALVGWSVAVVPVAWVLAAVLRPRFDLDMIALFAAPAALPFGIIGAVCAAVAVLQKQIRRLRQDVDELRSELPGVVADPTRPVRTSTHIKVPPPGHP